MDLERIFNNCISENEVIICTTECGSFCVDKEDDEIVINDDGEQCITCRASETIYVPTIEIIGIEIKTKEAFIRECFMRALKEDDGDMLSAFL